ncbi:unnamed protein product, partial [Discosporangium mesarthrocarpum]
ANLTKGSRSRRSKNGANPWVRNVGEYTGLTTQNNSIPPIPQTQPTDPGDRIEGCIEGYLIKKGGASWKQRWFTLDGPVVLYYQRVKDRQPRGRMVLMPESRVANLARVNAFQVITNAKALVVQADTPEERDRWVRAIRREVSRLNLEASRKADRNSGGKKWGRDIRTVSVAGTGFELDTKYELMRAIGHGAYGVVVSAIDHTTNTKVAIKKIPQAFEDLVDAKRIAREIRLLRHFNHKNIISVVDILPPASLDEFEDVYIVSELMDTDLQRIIQSRQLLSVEHVQ